MLLALFVPLASAGAQDDGPDGETLSAQAVAEEGGTLDATPESATNMVAETHTITVTVTDENDDPENDVTVIGTVDETGVDAASYAGGLPPATSETCDTGAEEDDADGVCTLTFNEDEVADSGKDRIRVFRDDNDNGTWDEEEEEDYDFVTKTWVDEDDEGVMANLFGDDRIETAVDISQHKWLGTDDTPFDDDAHADAERADAVVIARADLFPDALAGSPFAVGNNGPLLLTFPDSLDERTEDELQRVLEEGETVYLLGQTDAISLAVEARVEELGYETERLGGLTRFETAVQIAEETEDQQGALEHLFIARSHEFPDALTGGAAAASVDLDEGSVGAILLTFDQAKHDATESFLDQHEDATTYALGGPIVNPYACAVEVDHDNDDVTDTWLTQSRCEDDENTEDEDTADWAIFGADRHETARAIAEFFFVDPTDVGVARSDLFPDALTGGAHIGQFNGPILLTPTTLLHQDAERYLCHNADTIDTAYVYGGDHAVAADTRADVDDAVDGDGGVCDEHDVPGHWVNS